MKMKWIGWLSVALGAGFLANMARADEPTLKVGDKAPMLQSGDYVQGQPIGKFEDGKAYIVEF